MNKAAENFLKGLFDNINDQTAYRLGLWINGLIAAAVGAALGGTASLVGQLIYATGTVRWAVVVEWAKAGILPTVIAYFAKSPLQSVFTDAKMTIASTTQTTPASQMESTVAVVESNESSS